MYARSKYSDRQDKLTAIPDPIYSKKYDGACFFMPIDAEGRPRFISRRQAVDGTYPDRTEKLPQLAALRFPSFAGKVFNLELHHTGTAAGNKDNHPMISGILNSLVPKAIEAQRQHGPVRAKVFDVIDSGLNTYGAKLNLLREAVHEAGNPDLFDIPEHVVGHEAGKVLIQSTKDRGDEGVIALSLTLPESENTRIKVKHIGTYNLIVTKINQEVDVKGVPKNRMGSVEVADAAGRNVGNVSGFTAKDKEDAWNNPASWLGRRIQVRAYPPTAHKLRSPQYNGDADGAVDVV